MALRAPRIMQRKRTTPYERSEPGGEAGTSLAAPGNSGDEIDEVLDSSGVYIQDGVMLRIQDSMSSEERRILSEETAYEQAERFHAASKERRSITVDDSTGGFTGAAADNHQPYIENRLPGIADEVESYPCRLCVDKVFLTGFGLEKHAKAMHKDHVAEMVRQIRIIGDEWKRRNVERSKIRERIQALKFRQEQLAVAAARQFRGGAGVGRRWNADGAYNYVIPSNQLDLELHGNTTAGIIGSAGGPFEACSICNVQINVSHPTALETHMRAHKRNDELRESMLDQLGHEAVARLTCHECQLVFTDERKLSSHVETMHVRKRKFVCKWCGYVSASVAELNEHKIDVHAMPASGGPRPIPMMTARKGRGEVAGESSKNEGGGRGEKKSVGMEKIVRPTPSVVSSTLPDECQFSIVRTCCPECALPFNRPSLLLKHMLRVHSKDAFTATIDTRGLPPFSVQVDRGRVVWSCCGRNFSDRVTFCAHRQKHSVTSIGEADLMPMGVLPTSAGSSGSASARRRAMPPAQEEVVVSSEEMKGRRRLMEGEEEEDEYNQNAAIMGADGTIEIVVPEGAKHGAGMQYMLVVDDINGEERRRVVTIDPRADPEDVMREHGIRIGGDAIGAASREGPGGSSMEEGEEEAYMEDENGQIIMSSEQFEQYAMQYGDDLSNMHVLFVEDGDGTEEIGEERQGGEGELEEDGNTLQHDILEPHES